jgi:hypothetical protein
MPFKATEQFQPIHRSHHRGLESPTFHVLSRSALMIISRVEIELAEALTETKRFYRKSLWTREATP